MKQISKTPLFSSLSEIYQALDHLFEPLVHKQNNYLAHAFQSNWTPNIDIKDEHEQYVIRADIPGVLPQHIDISFDNGFITIKGHKKFEEKEEQENFLHLERSYGSFYRTINLPNADSSKIKAKTKNGVLEIIVPKIQESSLKKIHIEEE